MTLLSAGLGASPGNRGATAYPHASECIEDEAALLAARVRQTPFLLLAAILHRLRSLRL